MEQEKPQFERIDITQFCFYYTTGKCCHDLHFDPREVAPAMQANACGWDSPDWQRTTNKDQVNCKECLEMIHS